MNNSPTLELSEDSEILADIDEWSVDADGNKRPIYLVKSDGGDGIFLTLSDAKRLYQYLESAINYLEGKAQ